MIWILAYLGGMFLTALAIMVTDHIQSAPDEPTCFTSKSESFEFALVVFWPLSVPVFAAALIVWGVTRLAMYAAARIVGARS